MEETTLHIEGTVENIVFRNESNGYIVLDIDSGGEMITVVGCLGDIDEGEVLELYGKYENTPKFGTQFHADYCNRKLPDTSWNIEKYLSSGAVKGIGAGLAKKIVNVFGSNTLNIIEKSPQRLCEVKGISPKKAALIAEESKKLFALRTLTDFLMQYKIMPAYAMRLYRCHGTDSMELMTDNPYILCDTNIGLEFTKADFIAKDMNIPNNAHCRIAAGTKYIISSFTNDGHTCMPIELLAKNAVDMLKVSEQDFYKSYKTELEENELFSYKKDDREYIYLPDYFHAESYISDRIHILSDFSSPDNFNYDKLIDSEEQEKNIHYGEKQRYAIETALSRRLMVLTGNPGTGKTTTLNAIISILEKKGDKVLLAAPTGRAAKRMSELTGHTAKTIHRLLEVSYISENNLTFSHNENNPLECDDIIIDEMSMVDCLLFEKLLCALRIGCRLIMVGDFHQLPSVGSGNLLEDIIRSGTVPVVELTEVFRQAQKSCIITNANKIIVGEYPDLSQKNNDFFFFSRYDRSKAVDLIADLTVRRLPNAYNYSPVDDIQILTPSNKGTTGTDELNKILQEKLNPPARNKPEYKTSFCVFRTGDKVMQTQNNYDIVWSRDDEQGTGIFNGDIGKIISINKSSKTAVINFDGRLTEYPFEMLEQIKLAYAITVHKSQGSEFDVVIMPVLEGFYMLSYRNLLYTAITRAKKLLILVGTQEQVKAMVDNNERTVRYTCLKDMLAKNS